MRSGIGSFPAWPFDDLGKLDHLPAERGRRRDGPRAPRVARAPRPPGREDRSQPMGSSPVGPRRPRPPSPWRSCGKVCRGRTPPPSCRPWSCSRRRSPGRPSTPSAESVAASALRLTLTSLAAEGAGLPARAVLVAAIAFMAAVSTEREGWGEWRGNRSGRLRRFLRDGLAAPGATPSSRRNPAAALASPSWFAMPRDGQTVPLRDLPPAPVPRRVGPGPPAGDVLADQSLRGPRTPHALGPGHGRAETARRDHPRPGDLAVPRPLRPGGGGRGTPPSPSSSRSTPTRSTSRRTSRLHPSASSRPSSDARPPRSTAPRGSRPALERPPDRRLRLPPAPVSKGARPPTYRHQFLRRAGTLERDERSVRVRFDPIPLAVVLRMCGTRITPHPRAAPSGQPAAGASTSETGAEGPR